MANAGAWDDSDDEEKEGDERDFDWGGRDGVIFLIDATQPMFIKQEDEAAPFRTCLECCRTTMLNKIIGSEKDLIGVVLFGTNKTENVLNVSHITTLQDLNQPSADKIKQLEKMLESDTFDDFENTYGHSTDFALSDALWLSQMLFSNSTFKLASQRILLFTCSDNPHAGNTHRQRQALKKAEDLCNSGVDLELLHLGTNFDPAPFYQELVQLALGEDYAGFVLPDPATKLDELLTRVCRRNHKKRSVGRVLFKLGGDVQLSVGIYNLVRRTQMPKRVWLDGTTNETVHSVLQSYDAVTGELMLPLDLAKYQLFGGKKIVFQMEEVRNVRQMMEQGLYLMGFKPADRIKLHYHFKPSSFIYPDNTMIKGSRQLFAALLERCVSRNVVPICWLSARLNSPPQLVALVPQPEKIDDTNTQILPPGFHVVFLPYADNIRNLELTEIEQAAPEQMTMMKKIINKLKFNYSPHSFDNPKLQTHWSNVEALAMDYPSRREVTDYTKPNHAMMVKKLGDLATSFEDMFYPAGFNPVAKAKARPAAATKRAAGPAPAARAAKAAKAGDINMQDLALQGKVEKCKVDELKAYLIGENVKVTGKKKADLVKSVYEHLDISQPK